MTDFKITPEDVGRVAVEKKSNGSFTIVAEANGKFFVEWKSSVDWEDPNRTFNHGVVRADGSGFDDEGDELQLTHWKPKTLEAPNRWWNVYQSDPEDGYQPYHAKDYVSYADAVASESMYTGELIARIYAPHWHGEEVRFDTPESIGETS